ncbi:hypothetical protein ATO12_05510 [Aquimarina atlantica]|uniref:Uncharacterized protein n=1 Tax=Aquimarina atlantica TaxID=1317122 RepID=A0A023BPC9_9FLAO|nr:hypothetical protein [Aquimarina atlantica]EZH71836.1 hypothetical protein ATO12_05510 [Aquimarina atlantica]
MAIVDRPTLYSYFETGDRPTQNQFVDLIDSNFNLAENSLAQGWMTRFLEVGEDVFIIEAFSIPLGVNEASNVRFSWRVNPDGAGDVTATFTLFYYSDIQNTDFPLSGFDIFGGFFKHTVVSEEIVVPGSTTDNVFVDELIALDLPLLHNNIQLLVVYLTLGAAESSGNPIMSFEFN